MVTVVTEFVAFHGVYQMLSLTTARWITEVKEESIISFDNHIFSEIHQLKTYVDIMESMSSLAYYRL